MARWQLFLCILLFLPLAIGFQYRVGKALLAPRYTYCEERANHLGLSDAAPTRIPRDVLEVRFDRLLGLVGPRMSDNASQNFTPELFFPGEREYMPEGSARDFYLWICERHNF
jgi:hypothetical protein